jgi:hypothetical protein
MPHAVIEGEVDLVAWARELPDLLERRGADVLRTGEVLVERGGRAVLVEATAVEAGRRQGFYVRVSAQASRATVRIDPLSRVERSEGVRALVALVAADLLARTPGAKLGSSNLVLPSAASRRTQA